MTSRLIATFSVLSLLLIPQVFAQQVRLTAPQTVQLGQEVILSIQILDSAGDPITDSDPAVSFSPDSAADEVSLFNCVDVGDKENCGANTSGIDGFYESVFVVNQLPLTVTVSAEGKTSQTVLNASGATPASPEVSQPSAGAGTVNVQPVTPKLATTASVQVGPWPSFWLIIAPFLLMAVGVTYFVAKTD